MRILGQYHPVRAIIVDIDGFSAHADKNELLKWISSLKSPPRRIFVVHGEPALSDELSSAIKEKIGWNVSVPVYLDEVILD